MLRFGASAAAAEDEELLNVTAMVDVVFILLSFFVLTTRFIGAERELALGAAERAAATGLQAQDLPPSIAVELAPGEAGGVAIRLGQVRLPENAFDELTARLQALELPELPVVIAADAALPVAAVARGMEAVLRSPNQRVSLTATDSPNPTEP